MFTADGGVVGKAYNAAGKRFLPVGPKIGEFLQAEPRKRLLTERTRVDGTAVLLVQIM
jgi:hypothetical protein